MEYFDESLVLLKRELCWDLDDVVYFKLNQRSLEYKQLELTTQQEVWFKCKPSLRLKSPVALSWARLKRQTPIRVMTDMNHQNPRIFPYFQFSCSIAVDKVRKQFVFFRWRRTNFASRSWFTACQTAISFFLSNFRQNILTFLSLPPQGFRPEAKAWGGHHWRLQVYIQNVFTVRIDNLYTR